MLAMNRARMLAIFRRTLLVTLALVILSACGGSQAEPTAIPEEPTVIPEEATAAPAEPTATAAEPSATPAEPTVVPEEPTAVSAAQQDVCPDDVMAALTEIDAHCAITGRNQVCYGNVRLNATPRGGIGDFRFDSPGDVVNVFDIDHLALESDVESNVWGVALMRLQANIPDTLPGQNLTFLLFGNAELSELDGASGLQSFYFRSGVGDSPCLEAPDSGMLVQTPEGVRSVSFQVNGIDIDLGSTAFMQARPGEELIFNVIEGQAGVTSQGVTERVQAGTRTRIQLDADGVAASPPSPPESYESEALARLPVANLERQINIARLIVSSRFDDDTEGWTAHDTGADLTHNTDETAGGFVCAVGDEAWYFQAVDAWSGDRGAAYGGELTYALRRESGEAGEIDAADVLLVGGGLTLAYRYDSPPGVEWTTYRIPLRETAGWVDADSGEPVSAAGLQSALASLEVLRIRGGYGDDPACLESAWLTGAVPPRIIRERPQRAQIAPTVTPFAAGPAEAAPVGFAVDDAIDTPGEQKIYTFDAAPGQVVYFESQGERDFALRWTLTDEDGQNLFNRHRMSSDPGAHTLERGGEYVMTIEADDDHTGTFAFQLWDVPEPQEFTTAIGETVTDGALAAVGAMDIYTFEAEPGQVVYFESVGERDFALRWTLADEDGQTLFNRHRMSSDPGGHTLERGGEYTMIIEADGTHTGEYAFTLWDVPEPQEFTTTIGETVMDGALAAVGAMDIYTFEAEPGQVVYFESVGERDFALRWTLADEDGQTLFNRHRMSSDPGGHTLERGGEYTMIIEADGTHTGEYAFTLWDVPEPQEFTTTIGETVMDGALAAVGAMDIYTFEAEPGQVVYFESVGERDFALRWTLADEDGQTLFNRHRMSSDPGGHTLERGGEYTMIIEADGTHTGEYAFTLWDGTEPQEIAIPVPVEAAAGVLAEVAGEITTPGQELNYTTEVSAGQIVYFEVLSESDLEIRWEADIEDGPRVFSQRGMSGDPGRHELEEGGTLVITIWGRDTHTGEFNFQVIDVPQDQTFAIEIDEVVALDQPEDGAGMIAAIGQQHIYTTEVSAGQIVYFEVLSESDLEIRWEAYIEDGPRVFSQRGMSGDPGRHELEEGGTLVITVWGRDTHTGEFSFQVIDVPPDLEFAIEIDEVVALDEPAEGAGMIAAIGQQHIYTTEVEAGQIVYFEVLSESDLEIRWEAYIEDGPRVFSQRGMSGDPGRHELEEGGTLVITVWGRDTHTGEFSFAVWDGPEPPES
jgi:hypothetical protein